MLGNTVKERIDFLVKDVVHNSTDKNDIVLSTDTEKAMKQLRSWLFLNLYDNKNKTNKAKAEEEKAQKIIEILYGFYLKNIDKLPNEYKTLLEMGEVKEQVVADYISGMTDDYALFKFNDIFIPRGWKLENEF